MAIVVGMDEAGLSPLLGPLVLSAVAVSVPDEHVDRSLWDLLGSAVCRKPASKSAVAIDDSKKLYSTSNARGLKPLERGVLAALASADQHPADLSGLLKVISPQTASELSAYPWYSAVDRALPHSADATDVSLAGNALRKALADIGSRLVGMRSEPVLVGQFNRLVAATRNKATTLFDLASRLLVWAWRYTGDGLVSVHVDRLGGRQRYAPGLQRVFDGCHLKIEDETQHRSAYVITQGSRHMRVAFSVDGDSQQLPIALASMLSKYVRELFMASLNGFWSGHVGDLKRTSGYHTDGKRFIEQIEPMVQQLGIDRSLLVRTR